ncbi:MAG: hypothetical protein JRJ37_12405, partial [Deltaproteobacteria bacterium]|nr:hypothetical protein [Deltaproteobacteria bacterium]
DLGAKQRKKKADELKKVIKRLRKKEKDLIAESEKVGNGKKRDMLRKRIDILHAQRKKGLKALKKIG